MLKNQNYECLKSCGEGLREMRFFYAFVDLCANFKQKSQRTQPVECSYSIKFEIFLSLCTMRFFVENWHNESHGHKKYLPFLKRGRGKTFCWECRL